MGAARARAKKAQRAATVTGTPKRRCGMVDTGEDLAVVLEARSSDAGSGITEPLCRAACPTGSHPATVEVGSRTWLLIRRSSRSLASFRGGAASRYQKHPITLRKYTQE